MSKFRLVIEDEDLYFEHELESRRRGIRLSYPDMKDEEIDKILRKYFKVKDLKDLKKIWNKVKGDVHTEMDTLECPDELPCCRNCGDPEYKEKCAEQGHCPLCGISHGMSPDVVIKHTGMVLEEVIE